MAVQNTYYILFFFMVIINVNLTNSILKTWRYNADIFDPTNWLNDETKPKCKGLLFSSINTAPIFIDRIFVEEIILPRQGEIIINEGGFIKFKSSSRCMRINEISYNFWNNPNAWQYDGDDNSAIPHVERPPCQYDDVNIPNGYKSAITLNYISNPVKVNSLKIEGEKMDNRDLQLFLNSFLGKKMFGEYGSDKIYIETFNCADLSGCYCGNKNFEVCSFISEPVVYKCKTPILPIGFCNSICGAHLIFQPTQKFRINEVRALLKKYESIDTHVSKVLSNTKDTVQIVFTEKDFTGKSLDYAEEVFNVLNDELFKNKLQNLELHSSGYYYVEGLSSRTSLTIIFGSLIFVLFIFFIIFMLYEYQEKTYNFFNRLNIGTRTLSTYKPYMFAKYDKEEASLIIGEEQRTGSILNLDKSFENSLYGQELPSTSSLERLQSKIETIHESEYIEEESQSIGNLKETDKETSVIMSAYYKDN